MSAAPTPLAIMLRAIDRRVFLRVLTAGSGLASLHTAFAAATGAPDREVVLYAVTAASLWAITIAMRRRVIDEGGAVLIGFVVGLVAIGGRTMSTAASGDLVALTAVVTDVHAVVVAAYITQSRPVARRIAIGAVLLFAAVSTSYGVDTGTAIGAAVNGVLIVAMLDLLAWAVSGVRDHAGRQHDLAERDDLTGLRNRRGATAALGQVGAGDGVLLVDLDHFKRINDTAGHDVGDAVLVEVGRVLTGSLRSGDVVARWGGEEFLVVVRSATSAQDVAGIAETLRAAVADSSAGVTASIGGAILGEGETWEEALRRADAGLYRAKRAGRNAVVADA